MRFFVATSAIADGDFDIRELVPYRPRNHGPFERSLPSASARSGSARFARWTVVPYRARVLPRTRMRARKQDIRNGTKK